MASSIDIKNTRGTIKWMVRMAVIFFLMIAGLRFYSSYIEQQVVEITRSIEEISAEEMSMKQELSALVSPIKIYDHCRLKLGMKRATDLTVINKPDKQ